MKETKAISQLAAEQDLHPKESRRVPRAQIRRTAVPDALFAAGDLAQAAERLLKASYR